MPSYKLIYFDGRGRAEVSRMLFKMSGQEFEDHRVQMNEWSSVKPNTLFSLLPMLEIDGIQYSESKAIERYLAKEFGLYGNSTIEQLKADQLVDYTDEVMKAMVELFWSPAEKQEELRKKYVEELAPGFLANMEKVLNPDGYVNGNKVTWPDIRCYFVFEYAKLTAKVDLTKELEKNPKLTALIENVTKEPKIAAWIAERPGTMF